MEDEKKAIKLVHNIIIESRKTVNISGVLDVESFDEQTIKLKTSEGSLDIKGEGLQIEKINIESGEMLLKGRMDSFAYSRDEQSDGGFFGKLFR